MTCPACGRELVKMPAGPIAVDACASGCAGIWFDRFELDKVDEQSESAGASLLEMEGDRSVAVDLDDRRTCPNCGPSMVMMRHFSSVARRVVIDQCPNCSGVWLDAGELNGVRSEFASEEARHAAAQELFSEMFDSQLQAARAESREELESARQIAGALRYICPSTYLPGKQEGGAY